MNKSDEFAPVFGDPRLVSKIEKWGWTIRDEPGHFQMIDKRIINIHPAYQRHIVPSKVLEIAKAWSWLACGVVILGQRGNELWAIDGQHRIAAANKRSDITTIPCLVFPTDSVEQEARGFLDVNTGRKPVSGIDRFRANIASGHKTAIAVNVLLDGLGIKLRSCAIGAKEFKSISWAMTKANENWPVFETVMHVASDICSDCPVSEWLVSGLFYLQTNGMDITNKKIRERIYKVGAVRLVDSAKRASAYYAGGGAKIWGLAMLDEINKGLHNKITIAA